MDQSYITKNYTNEVAVRIIALQVVVVSLIAVLTQFDFLFLILALDFFLRSFTRVPSPLAIIAKFLIQILELKPQPIFAAPKKFAAGLGFGMALVIFVLFQLQFELAAYSFTGFLILCAFLESAFKICLGCSVHSLLVAPILNSRSNKH